jgi:hypothetical protein
MEGAILSFGSATSMPERLAAELIANMKRAQTSLNSSPRSATASPRRANYLPHRTTQDMLDHVSQHAALGGAPASPEYSNSLQVGNWVNTVVVPVEDLSPDVINGLECADAVPFVILRWLSTCLVEVCCHGQPAMSLLLHVYVQEH